jgi:hypothetical protein
MKLGKGDKPTDAPTHVKGIKQGNSTGNYEKQDGHLANGKSTAERSTGINAGKRQPIDPRMPNIPPA